MRATSTVTTRDMLRRRNLRAVVDAIHHHGPISRSQLRKHLGLSGASMTSLTADLLADGVILEAHEGHSDRAGRKPILLAVDYGHAYVAGVKISHRSAVLALTNLRAEVLATASIPLDDRTPAGLVTTLADAVERLRASTAGLPAHFEGIGLSLPGIVDPTKGEVRYSPYDAWDGVPFAKLLSDRTGVPVLLENDVNALAVAEAWFGAGKDHSDFLVVTLGRGVGLGIVLGGTIYRGPHGGAGEFGHVPLDCDANGDVRTVEDVLSDGALVAEAQSRSADGTGPADAAQLLSAADAGDPVALSTLTAAGEALGRALALLVNTFAPTLIVLGGEGVRSAHHLLGPARAALERYAFGDLASRVDVVVEPWGDDAWARGAAGLSASRYLSTSIGRR